MNITLDLVMRVHQAGIEFMEEAKRVFTEGNSARSQMDLLSVETFHIPHNQSFTKLLISYSMVGRKTSVRKVLSVRTRWIEYLVHSNTP